MLILYSINIVIIFIFSKCDVFQETIDYLVTALQRKLYCDNLFGLQHLLRGIYLSAFPRQFCIAGSSLFWTVNLYTFNPLLSVVLFLMGESW